MDREKNSLPTSKEERQGREHLDFLTAILLIALSLATIATSLGYSQRQRVDFYASAGFMPTVIGLALLFMGVLLLRDSLKGSSVRVRLAQLSAAAKDTATSSKVHKSVLGLLIFGFYVFFLLGKLPFWLASFLALAAVLIFVHFDKKMRTILSMLVIAALSIAGIVLLFQVAFSVPMP